MLGFLVCCIVFAFTYAADIRERRQFDIINYSPVAVMSVRLAGRGSTPYEGRLEVYLSGHWGTVCNIQFDYVDARVVCSQLGYTGPGVPTVMPSHTYGQGTGRIIMGSVACLGYETMIDQCPHVTASGYDDQLMCPHSMDVGIKCDVYAPRMPSAPEAPTRDAALTITTMRLSGSPSGSSAEGRVEVYVMGSWRSVCDDAWDNMDAEVVCRQLGYNRGQAVPNSWQRFGFGLEDVWLDEVACSGYEVRLDQCRHPGFGVHDCDGTMEAAAVDCTIIVPQQMPIAYISGVRLSGGSSAQEGRVEVFSYGRWMSMCSYGFGDAEASVVCRMMGFPDADVLDVRDIFYGYGHGIAEVLQRDADCTGLEMTLNECSQRSLMTPCDGRTSGIIIQCIGRQSILPALQPFLPGLQSVVPGLQLPSYITGVHLLNNAAYNSNEGLLIVEHSGEYGTVCNIGFSYKEATVICKMLGHSYGQAIPDAIYRYGFASIEQILLANLSCTGLEMNVNSCHSPSIGANIAPCTHLHDVGIICY